MRPPGAIVVGGGITGLAMVRALGRRGIDVALVTDDRGDFALRSRWCLEGLVLVEIGADGAALAALLDERAIDWSGRVLLPANDEALEALARWREPLEPHYRVPVPSFETVRSILRKDLTQRAAEAVGIDVARNYGPAERITLARDDIAYPVVVKPIESRPFVHHFGLKLFVARDRKELANAIDRLMTAGLRGLVLDLIPGSDRCLYDYTLYVDSRGEPTAEQAMRRFRLSPPFYGVSRVVEPVVEPALREPTLELLRSIGWRGIAEACYKLDPRDGRFRLLEVNGRCFTQVGLAMRCGLDYAHLAWNEAVTGECTRATTNGWPGIWVHLLDDLYYGLLHRRVERLKVAEYLEPYRRPRIHAVWSAADPLPFLSLCSKTVARSAAAAGDHAIRSRLRDQVQAMPA